MEEAPLRNLRELAWFERNLDAGVSTLHLDDERLIAGDWDGGIHCWNLEGEPLWHAQTSNRVSNVALGGDFLFAVCGHDLVCLNLESGEIRWVRPGYRYGGEYSIEKETIKVSMILISSKI